MPGDAELVKGRELKNGLLIKIEQLEMPFNDIFQILKIVWNL
jgi:hypothetical protein